MKEKLILSLCVLQSLFHWAAPATAQESLLQLDSQCRGAIQSAQERLEQNRSLTTNIHVVNMVDSRAEYPEGQPLSIGFTLRGSAAPSVMQSPQMLKAISTEIITNCQPVSTVTFSVFPTDWSTAYGWFADGRIEEFKCLAPEHSGGRTPYGYQSCL